MNADENEFLTEDAWTWISPEFEAVLRATPDELRNRLGSRRLGRPVIDHRSSWVRRAVIGTQDCYVKTYDYPRLADRLRGCARNTCLAASRVRRERDGLLWLAAHGFVGPKPLAIAELRSRGLLRRAVLVTAAWPGRDLDALWPSLPEDLRTAVLAAVWQFVDAIHGAGFRDRNLDPRNLLVRLDDPSGIVVAKIDSPRHRIVAPRTAGDRLAREDRARLSRGLDALCGRRA